ncbi:MAG: MFS transporter [Chloroflexi bacterium]|nr:MFS transporter [Chloroflexota bacterium]OJV96543.1 MAG: hypothetical protein BGO39_09795 [Chloroflexi bacterium 54-19]
MLISPPEKKAPFYINRDFGLFWVGQAISIIGDWLFDTTLVLWIANKIAFKQDWASVAVAGVYVATAIPALLVGPLAGVFVDRWPKRPVLLWMDALRALLVLLLIVASGLVPFLPVPVSTGSQLASIYGVVLLASVCSQFFAPAKLTLIGDLVSKEDRPRASSFLQGNLYLAVVLGPLLAPILFFGVGVTWALLAEALSYMASFATIFALKLTRFEDEEAPAGNKARFWTEFFEGLRFFAKNQVLRVVLISTVLATVGTGVGNALLFFFATVNLGAPPELFSILQTGLGIGLLVGVVLAPRYIRWLGNARAFWSGMLGIGVTSVIFAQLTNFPAAVAVFFLTGVVNALPNVASGPLVINSTPRELLGRVSAVFNPLTTLSALAASALGGYLYGTVLHDFHFSLLGFTFGPLDTIFTFVGLMLVAAGVYAWWGLRDARDV